MRALLLLFLLFPLLLRPAHASDAAIDGIILIIADGTSSELITATRVWKHGVKGRLALEELPETAFVRTYSANDMVTDSSAAATAMARGRKADNAAVGVVDPPSPSIVELTKRAGWNTAILSDDEVQGGTASPFYAVAKTRRRYDIIARLAVEALGNSVDILAGGGAKWFKPDPNEEDAEKRQNLLENAALLEKSRIHRVNTWEEFARLQDLSRPVLATFWEGTAPYYADGKRTPRLADLAEKIVTLFQVEKKPFLLVIESALPDKAAHQNSAKRAMTEVLELDETIARLRGRISAQTLMLVTSDHGTGGLAFNGYVPARLEGDSLLRNHPVTDNPILTWASGPGRQDPPLQADPLAPDATQPSLVFAGSALHTGGDVWLLGQGPGSEAVRGFLDNTEVFQIMKNALERSSP